MNPLLAHKRSAGAFLLCFFIFSVNALLYGFHAVEDGHLRQMVSGISAQQGFCDQILHHDHHSGSTGEQGSHGDNKGCCESHVHAAFILDPVQVNRTSVALLSTVAEPFKVTPEVYLDRFIPPQNLA